MDRTPFSFSPDDVDSASPLDGHTTQAEREALSTYHDEDEEFGDSRYQDHDEEFRTPLKSSSQLHQSTKLAHSFRRVRFDPPMDDEENHENEDTFIRILSAINMRNKYVFVPQPQQPIADSSTASTSPDDALSPGRGADSFYSKGIPVFASTVPDLKRSQHAFKYVDGTVHVYASEEEMNREGGAPLWKPVAGVSDYYRDLTRLMEEVVAYGPCKTLSFKRLRLLEAKFEMHKILNNDKEKAEQKTVPHRDFYNVYKIDTHIHLSSAMNQKHLLNFIKRKLHVEPDAVVIFRDGKNLTLREVFESLKLTSHDLSVDTLDVHADPKIFHRFDRFNLKYNPVGESRLREIFLKTDNMIQGRFLAEMMQELIKNLEASKYQCAEWRVSVYGRSVREWDSLAAWVVDNNLISNNVRFLVQVPRLYAIYKENKQLSNFQEMLANIFTPLFEVTRDPESHPKLHTFLQYCVGIDCVDDESKPEPKILRKYPDAEQWNFDKNPPYSYYLYYLYSNLFVLNKFRESRGLSTLEFRPHSGEAGDADHLASAFLLCQGIAHGIMLRKTPVLQYLYYLTQMGLYMSPLSNNSLFLDYSRNPFPVFFGRGLNVSLSTDDPLQFHYTKEPIIEEYSIAAQVWKLTTTDICEIAQNSVLHSGFPHNLKSHFLGPNYTLPGVAGNDIRKSNVPNIRRMFRHETLIEELRNMLAVIIQSATPDIMNMAPGNASDLSWLVDQLRSTPPGDMLTRSLLADYHRKRRLSRGLVSTPLTNPVFN